MSIFDAEQLPFFSHQQASFTPATQQSPEAENLHQTVPVSPIRPLYNHSRNSVSVPDRISALYRRYHYFGENASCSHSRSSYGSLASSRPSSPAIIEVLFTRLLDALIFTSAIAITAYNYWTGSLNDPPPPSNAITAPPQPVMSIKQWRQAHAPKRNNDVVVKQHDYLEDSRRLRTQQWAEDVAKQQLQQLQQTPNNKHCISEVNSPLVLFLFSSIRFDLLSFPWRTLLLQTSKVPESTRSKKRTQSLPIAPANKQGAQDAQEKEDEMFARMEERLQSLIQEGQAALSSKVELYELDENEIAMRKSFAAAKKKYSV